MVGEYGPKTFIYGHRTLKACDRVICLPISVGEIDFVSKSSKIANRFILKVYLILINSTK